MRELIKKQLQKCSYADLSNFDPETRTYHIPKYSKPHYEIGKMYLIQLPAAIVGRTDSVIATNWNNGTAPQYEFLKIHVSKTLGKMIYVDSIGYDTEAQRDINILWTGWLPTESITLVNQL